MTRSFIGEDATANEQQREYKDDVLTVGRMNDILMLSLFENLRK